MMQNHRLMQLFILFSLTLTSLVATANPSLVFGHEAKLFSKVVGEERTLLISLPDGYDTSGSTRYPVFYALDGIKLFKPAVAIIDSLSSRANMLPPHIVVAITNTDRYRDLTPSVPKRVQPGRKPGGADKFIEFIKQELIPHIDKTYRTNDLRTLAGHSLAGLFVLHTMVSNKDLFDHYIAMSPWVIFNDNELVKRAAKTLKTSDQRSGLVFMTIGNEPTLQISYDKFVEVINKQGPKNLELQSHVYPLENHFSTPSKTLHNAMIAISQRNGWVMKPELIAKGLDAIKAHYQQLSKRLGYPALPPENDLNQLGYTLLGEKKLEQSIAVFQYNNLLYPKATNTYDSLADALEAAGRLADAKKSLEKAIKLATEQQAGSLAQLQGHLQAVEEKIAKL